MFLEYLDLPQVPDRLIRTYEEITAINPRFSLMQQYPFYESRILEAELRKFVNEIFINAGLLTNVFSQYHFLHPSVPMHKDVGRTVAYNFLLYPGGNNVITSFYDNDKNLLESHCIEPFRWHRLTVDTFHHVSGIDSGLRVAITVNEKHYNN